MNTPCYFIKVTLSKKVMLGEHDRERQYTINNSVILHHHTTYLLSGWKGNKVKTGMLFINIWKIYVCAHKCDFSSFQTWNISFTFYRAVKMTVCSVCLSVCLSIVFCLCMHYCKNITSVGIIIFMLLQRWKRYTGKLNILISKSLQQKCCFII